MSENSSEQSNGTLKRIFRVALWSGTSLLIVAIVVIVPLSTFLLAIGVLSQANIRETIMIITGILTVIILFWGLIYWSEKTGIARWNEDEREKVELGLENWDNEDE